MEGRHPPPKASHPFPDSVDLTKFWGTGTAKGFFKFSICLFLALGGILGGNMYLTRNEKGLFGQDWTMTKEDMEKRRKILTFKIPTGLEDFPAGLRSQGSLGRVDLGYDDTISFEKFSMDFPLTHRNTPSKSD